MKKIFSTITVIGYCLLVIVLSGCDDQKMEWGLPDGHAAVTAADIPTAVKEVLANYDVIKTYSAQNHPDMILGLGVGKDIYLGTDGRHELAAGNFQMVTWGNAMKMDAIVGNAGTLNFANLDPALDQLQEDGVALYGHNFFWHTQQQQTYLKSLIKPELVVESDSDIKNMLAGDASDFGGGTTGGWGSWGGNKDNVEVVSGAGPDGSAAVVLTNKGDGNFWEAQFAYTFDTPLSKDVEYTIRFKAKSSSGAGQLQFQYQNGTTYGSQGGYTTFEVGTSWATCEAKFTITDYDDVDRIILNFGKVGGSYTIDNIEFGIQQDNPMDLMLSCDFESGDTQGWGSWGSNKDDAGVVDGEGVSGSKALMLKNKGDGNFWEAQNAYTFDSPLKQGVEYTIRFKARSTSAAGQLQFQYQNGTTYGSQGGYNTFEVGTAWTPCEYTFTITDYDDVDRIILNFGKVGATYYIDDIEFGTLKATDPMDNILVGAASDFEDGSTGGWGSWGSNKESAEATAAAAHSGSYGLQLVNKGDGNAWEAQNAYTFDTPLLQNKKYIIQFYAKSNSAAGELQFQYQNGTTYGSQGGYNTFEVGTDWMLYQYEFTITDYDDVDRIILNFGKVGATYYIDDIKFGLAKDQASAPRRVAPRPNRAAKSYYVVKSAEEKSQILTDAMEAWVKGMAEHLAAKDIVPVGYDVINEAITDGNGNQVRGVDNVFGSSDNDGNPDLEPTENEQDGLDLHWANGHFYWGYYVKDYAVKAFQFARKYLPAETKLFYNDYNLETSDSKRAAAIKFVKDIDAANGSAIVDGIGTQMHITLSGTSDDAANNAQKVAELRAKVDKQFQELAATGKLIRVTELDVSLSATSPSSAQYKAQSDAYVTIFESYFANVPQAQQSGITIWSLTDADDEHEYWLKGEKPNLFDASFKRKWAYKGVCDALAGEDIGLQFGSDAYKAYYELQNVSNTVE